MNKRKVKSQAKKAYKTAKKYPKIAIAVTIILVIVIAVVLVLYFMKIGPFKPKDTLPSDKLTAGAVEDIENADLSIHFLELGNKYTGDCTFIKCGDTEVLIDAGSRTDSALAIKEYIDPYITDGVIEYVIATHAHQDHLAGFYGSKVNGEMSGILYGYEVENIIYFSNHKSETAVYKNFMTAVKYAEDTYGTNVYTAGDCYNNENGGQRKYFLDSDNKVSMNILYNRYYYETISDNPDNNYSVCMLLQQETSDGTHNYMFTGDLEGAGESALVDYYKNSAEDFTGGLPHVDLFKGGHHGSYTSTTEKLLDMIQPKNVAVCCCCGTTEYNASAGHRFPSQEFCDRVAKYTENIYCTTLIVDYAGNEFTSMNGNIVFYYDGELKLYCSANDTILKDTEWFKENRVWNGG